MVRPPERAEMDDLRAIRQPHRHTIRAVIVGDLRGMMDSG